MAPARGAEAAGPGQADGVPRDHPRRHRAGGRELARHRPRPGRRPGGPPDRRPAVRLPGLRRAVAQGQRRPVGRPGAEPGGPARRRARTGAHGASSPPATGTSTPTSPPRPAFAATLVGVDGQRVATGKDFDDRGQLKPATRPAAGPRRGRRRAAAAPAWPARPSRSPSVEEKPYRSSPKPPFMTSTLQQEGGRKLRLSAAQVMRVAQGLYERGYITYMRTDSITLSRHGADRGPVAGPRAVRPRVRARRAPHVHPQGEERAGGPRGHPPGGRDVPHARRRSPASCAATSSRSTT